MANHTDNKITGSGIGSITHNEAHTIEEYWTEERRANATPVPMGSIPKPAHEAHEAPAPGEAGHTEPGHSESQH